MFGGSGTASAYMLVYRRKEEEGKNEKLQIPEKWQPVVQTIKEAEDAERLEYESLKN